MTIPRRGKQGFTLVELLIVLAIMAVLAAVVVPNVTGMFGKGSEQAFDTDQKTIQQAAYNFYYDIHDDDPWNADNSSPGHYLPTADGESLPILPEGTSIGVDQYELNLTNGDDGNPRLDYNDGAATDAATDTEVETLAVWMGLLVNSPGFAAATDTPAYGSPLASEGGPYLAEIPRSASEINSDIEDPAVIDSDGLSSGTYTWIVDPDRRVYALYKRSGEYFVGFSGTYP